jgi:hypothetical protein
MIANDNGTITFLNSISLKELCFLLFGGNNSIGMLSAHHQGPATLVHRIEGTGELITGGKDGKLRVTAHV